MITPDQSEPPDSSAPVRCRARERAVTRRWRRIPAATAQAVTVVVLSSVAAGFGARGFGGEGLAAIAFFSVVALMAWGAWSLVTYQIRVRILPDVDTQANLGELLRTIGFASGPGILRIFGWYRAYKAGLRHQRAADARGDGRGGASGARLSEHRPAVAVVSLGWFLAIGFAVIFGLLFGPRLA